MTGDRPVGGVHLVVGDHETDHDGDGPLRIGRAADSDVTIDDPRVSRSHAIVEHVDGAWIIRDVGSSRGVWSDGVQVEQARLDDGCDVRLADPTDGPAVRILLASTPAVPPVDAEPAPTVLGDQTSLRVRVGGRELVFAPSQSPIRLGRDPECEVTLDAPAVSRTHCTITWEDDGWRLADAGSSGGTFVDGRRLRGPVDAAGSFSAFLAGEAEGAEVRIIAPGERPEPEKGSLPLPLLGAAALFVIVVVGAAFVLLGPDDGGDANSDAQLAALKRATVYIELQDATGGFVGGGSGTVVADGLVLTNAHVAAPDAVGQQLGGLPPDLREPDPTFDRIVVGVAPAPDAPADPGFVADVVAADGYLDLAVLRVRSDLEGNAVDSFGVEPIPISPDVVPSGSPIDAFGFPSNSRSDVLTLTRGVVSGVRTTPIIDGPEWYTTDVLVNPGNSGGLAAIDGELVGVPTAGQLAIGGSLNLLRPGYLASPLIDAALLGEPYDPYDWYLQEPRGDETAAGALTDGDDCDADPVDGGRSLQITSDTISAGQLVSIYIYARFDDGERFDIISVEVLPWPSDDDCLVVPSFAGQADRGAEQVLFDAWIGPEASDPLIPLTVIAQ